MTLIDDFPIIASTNSIAERQIAILQTLGRLEMAYHSWLKQLHFPDLSNSSLYQHLQRLHDQGLIWKQTGPVIRKGKPQQARSGVGAPNIYGLSNEGHQLLDTLSAESDQQALERLKSRDRRNTQLNAFVHHDLQVAWWCAVFIQIIRHAVQLKDIYVQVEYITERQRFDALIVVRFFTSRPKHPVARPVFSIPWRNHEPSSRDIKELAFALEVDRGTETLKTILEKAVKYRDLTLSGYYEQKIGVPVTPIFIAPTKRRVAQIIAECNHAWPDNPALISTPQTAMHKTWGTLWGTYIRMKDNKPQQLLEPIGCSSVEMWESWINPVQTDTVCQ